jgi:hypothetical protein
MQAAAMHRMLQDAEDRECFHDLALGGGAEGVLVVLADSLMGSAQAMQVGACDESMLCSCPVISAALQKQTKLQSKNIILTKHASSCCCDTGHRSSFHGAGSGSIWVSASLLRGAGLVETSCLFFVSCPTLTLQLLAISHNNLLSLVLADKTLP